jgi:hypothetical protein
MDIQLDEELPRLKIFSGGKAEDQEVDQVYKAP